MVPDVELLEHLSCVAVALVVGDEDDVAAGWWFPEAKEVAALEECGDEGIGEACFPDLGAAADDGEVTARDAVGDFPFHGGDGHGLAIGRGEGSEAVAGALIDLLKDELSDLLLIDGGLELEGSVSVTNAGDAPEAVPFGRHQGADAVVEVREAALES
jgi:hypothetical protein